MALIYQKVNWLMLVLLLAILQLNRLVNQEHSLTMRTFHVGGIASLTEQSAYFAKYEGVVQLKDARTVTNREGQTVVLSRKAKLVLYLIDGRELQRNDLEYGTILLVTDGQKVTAGTKLANGMPIIRYS